MLRRLEPEIGAWYENGDQQTLFEVVSIDEDGESLGIQYYDGEIEELDLDTFIRLPLFKVDQPEDWSGPYEMEPDDRFESDFTPAIAENSAATLNAEFEADSMHLLDE